MRNGRTEWIHSQYDESYGAQTIDINMKNYEGDITWWLDLNCVGQKE